MLQTRQPKSIRHPVFDVAERPFIVIWEITRACDLACAHCRAEAMPLRSEAELTTAQGFRLIDEIAAFGSPPPLFVMTGGDPMKRPDLTALVGHAAGRGLPVALAPSATRLFTPGTISDLKAAGLKAVSLSIDGATSPVHDAFRGIAGVFNLTMAIWDAARRYGLKVQINTSLAHRNLSDLPGIAQLVRQRGAMTWSLFLLVPVGRGANLEQISAAQCEDVLHFLYDVGTAIPAKTTEGHHYKRVVIERIVLERRGLLPQAALVLGPTYQKLRAALEPWPAGCHIRRTPMDVNAGRGFVFISHTGTVHGSGFLPFPAGNVREQPLGQIYRQSPVLKALRAPARLLDRCRRCEFAAVCGGSRSRAFAMTGNLFADDPLCNYQPGSFPFQDDVAVLLANARRNAAL